MPARCACSFFLPPSILSLSYSLLLSRSLISSPSTSSLRFSLFVLFFSLSFFPYFLRCFVPLNGDRPFAKCARRNLASERAKNLGKFWERDGSMIVVDHVDKSDLVSKSSIDQHGLSHIARMNLYIVRLPQYHDHDTAIHFVKHKQCILQRKS